MELTINVHITGLEGFTDALAVLGIAMQHSKKNSAPVVEDISQVSPMPKPVPAPVPVQPTTPPAPVPVSAPVQPVSQPAPAVPVAAPTAYTLPQLQKAAGELVEQGKREMVLDLLRKYNTLALHQLPAEQYGAFATDLRGLGAKI